MPDRNSGSFALWADVIARIFYFLCCWENFRGRVLLQEAINSVCKEPDHAILDIWYLISHSSFFTWLESSAEGPAHWCSSSSISSSSSRSSMPVTKRRKYDCLLLSATSLHKCIYTPNFKACHQCVTVYLDCACPNPGNSRSDCREIKVMPHPVLYLEDSQTWYRCLPVC